MDELFTLLEAEVQALVPELSAALKIFSTPGEDPDNIIDAIERYTEQVQRIASVAEMMEMEGLLSCIQFITDNLDLLKSKRTVLSPTQTRVFAQWVDHLLGYLQNTNEESAGILAVNFSQPEWLHTMPEDNAVILCEQLLTLPQSDAQTEEESRQETAALDDISLALPDDTNAQIYDSFLMEAPGQASAISRHIQNYLQAPHETEHVTAAQRITHTLKGAASTVGINGILNLSHHLEDILEYLDHHPMQPSTLLADILIEASDCLEVMVECLLGMGSKPENAQAVLQSVLDIANLMDKGELELAGTPNTTDSSPVLQDVAPLTEDTMAVIVSPENIQAYAEPNTTDSHTPEQHHQDFALRVPTQTINDLLRVSSELAVISEHMKEQIKKLMRRVNALNNQSNIVQARVFELETLVDIQGIPFLEKAASGTHHFSTHEEVFDPLELDQYHELHTHTRQFAEAATDVKELGLQLKNELHGFESLLREQHTLNQELQSDILSTRMVPIKTIIPRLERCVRQACRDTEKQATLVVSGADVLIDSDILNQAADPLMHILRNAVDHGIETETQRLEQNKTPQGKLTLKVYREGSNIVISCQDDGRGLDYEAIRSYAIKRGLLNTNTLSSRHELERLILTPGFSSKEKITKLSGRGVGLDVVNQTIISLKGALDIQSKDGEGLTLTLRIPITMISLHVLLFQVSNHIFAIPTSNVIRSLPSRAGKLTTIAGNPTYEINEQIYPVKEMHTLLGFPESIKSKDLNKLPAIMIRSDAGATVVFVDRIIDSRDSVIKSFGKYLKNIRGLSGAIIMGDGRITPVIDFAELLETKNTSTTHHVHTEILDTPEPPDNINVLIVEDSLSARRSLAQLINDAGFEASTATDGLDAISIIDKKIPDIMLIDLEMPRMNGLELAEHVRANDSTHHIPIIMITSRYTDKHRNQASRSGVNRYLTKPYSETEVLDSIATVLAG